MSTFQTTINFFVRDYHKLVALFDHFSTKLLKCFCKLVVLNLVRAPSRCIVQLDVLHRTDKGLVLFLTLRGPRFLIERDNIDQLPIAQDVRMSLALVSLKSLDCFL